MSVKKIDEALEKGDVLKSLLLIKELADINSEGMFSETALMHACRHNQPAVVEYMLELGARIDIADITNTQAIHLASSASVTCVELLINAGTDINVKNAFDETPLHKAVESNNFEVVQLLVKHGAIVDTMDNGGRSPLQHALEENFTDIYTFLKLHKSADNT